MIIHTDTTRFLWEVLEQGEYSFALKELVVIDGGCNIGAFSLWIWPIAKEIHAVDISADAIELFKKTVGANKLLNIKTYNCGLSEKTEVRSMDTQHHPTTRAWKLSEGGEGRIQTYSVADFMANNNIKYADILKLDVEGAETEILKASDFPSDKISTIVGEYHRDTDMEEINGQLESHGYRVCPAPRNHFLARKT